jgi:hypothetical protein
MIWRSTCITRGGVYSNQQISKHLKELDITWKIASIEAYQAQLEAVQHHVFCFWNCAPLLGICGIPWRILIDVDEFGISIERCNQKGGWTLKVFWVKNNGHYYYSHGQKINLLFPRPPPHGYGSIEHPRRWIKCVQKLKRWQILFL